MSRRRLRCGCWPWVSCLPGVRWSGWSGVSWGKDPTDWVAAEIRRRRTSVMPARWGRSPTGVHCGSGCQCGRVFVRGTIDMRMVLTIIARTENVEDTVIAELDEAISRHCEKWMKLSKDKLRDRVDIGSPSSIRQGCGSRRRWMRAAISRLSGASAGIAFVRACSCRGRRGGGSGVGCDCGHGV